jgi:hypothetical protein
LPAQTRRSGIAILFQILALTLSCLAIAWGTFCAYTAAFPGPCGDNPGPGLGVIETWLLNIPIGILSLLLGCFLKKGSPTLRTACIPASLITLALPVVANILLQQHHCP